MIDDDLDHTPALALLEAAWFDAICPCCDELHALPLHPVHLAALENEVGSRAVGARFDAILLDAPCSATGTIRRHPCTGDHAGSNDVHGIVIAVGPVCRGRESFIGLYILAQDGNAYECDVTDITIDDPAEARRRLTEPAPEWTGPDRWQYWIAESAYHPGDYAPLAPEGYKPVGPWECPCPPFVAANGTYNRDWRRPLRRVQG